MYDDIFILWDVVLNEIILNFTKEKPKKGKKDKNKINPIVPLGIKAQFITDYMEEVKATLVSDILKGDKLVRVKYWPSDEKIYTMIYEVILVKLPKTKKKKK